MTERPVGDEALLAALQPAQEEDGERLMFSLFDIKKRVENLRDELPTAQPATVAPNPGSDGQRSDATDRPGIDWQGAYRGIESFLYKAVNMAQIVDDMADVLVRDDPDSWSRFAFAVNHSRELLDDLQEHYDKRPLGRHCEQQS